MGGRHLLRGVFTALTLLSLRYFRFSQKMSWGSDVSSVNGPKILVRGPQALINEPGIPVSLCILPIK